MIIKIFPKIPYKWQKTFCDFMKKYNILIAPRQHGKTELVSEIVKSVAYEPSIRDPWINLCSDTITRLKALYKKRFDYIFKPHKDYKWPKDEGGIIQCKRPQGDHFWIKVHGATHNPKGPEGTTSHLNIVDEAGTVSKTYIKGALMPSADATNGINIITGTPAPGDFRELRDFALYDMKHEGSDWYVLEFKLGDELSRECRSAKQIQSIKRRYNLHDPEERVDFLRMYMCDWEALLSSNPLSKAVSNARIEGRVGVFPFNKDFKVGTAWDNGLGYKAVWFWQIINAVPRFIFYKVWKDESLRKTCRDIKDFYKSVGAEPYIHIFPHTMNEREESDGIKIKDKVLDFLEIECDHICNKRISNIENKIDITNSVMNMCQFHEKGCYEGLSALQNYRRKENLKTKVRSKGFVKDMHSHGAEAFGEFCLAWHNEELFGDDTYDFDSLGLNTKIKSLLNPY